MGDTELVLPDLIAFAREYAAPLRRRLAEAEMEGERYLAELRKAEQEVARLEERLAFYEEEVSKPSWGRRLLRR